MMSKEAHCKYPKCSYPCPDLPDCRDAEQPAQQEPVAWMTHSNDMLPLFHKTRAAALNWQTQPTPLYTRPQAREWVGLTATEVHETEGYEEDRKLYRFARAIKAKLREKNA